MRIAIDAAQAAADKKTGIEHFAYQLIDNILKYDQKNQYFLLTNKDVEFSSNNHKTHNTNKKRFWNKFQLPLLLIKGRYDIFLEPGNSLPSYAPKNSFTFIHDLGFKHFPNVYTINNKLLQETALKNAVMRAKGLFFLTNQAKKDFKSFYPNFRKRMEVTGLSIDKDRFSKSIDHKPFKDKYILFVGRLEKKKNVKNLVNAYAELCKNNIFGHKLVLAGKPGYGYEEIRKEIKNNNLSSNVIITGYVNDKDLPSYYKHADLFVFPSLYEGFGIPILEAFASETPVICSNTSSLPEVAGKGSKYFDPKKPSQIAKTITEVLGSKTTQNKLVKHGKERLIEYDWKKTAEIVIETFNSLNNK